MSTQVRLNSHLSPLLAEFTETRCAAVRFHLISDSEFFCFVAIFFFTLQRPPLSSKSLLAQLPFFARIEIVEKYSRLTSNNVTTSSSWF